ncbi:MAG TPA: HAMP domain-containing sensor histidine kinase [Kofleriaceae bacterium]|nr:HAMP domain-containing sensor histidine kinase [Kofleriaceae bacterium]
MAKRRRLVLRVYAFAVGLAIAITVALLILPRYTRGARYLEPQAALLQYMVDRWSLKNKVEFAEAMARIEPRLRGKLSLFDEEGGLVRTTVEPALDPPTGDERETLRGEKWALSSGRIVVRSDDGTLLGAYAPNRPGFPWSYVIPISAVILVFVGAASVWFSRRLARPLGQLASAARRFGAGDTSARVTMERRDELGDVGRAFDEMADRTAGVIQAQRQLMADVSHELRTPLARIRVALELAAEDPVAAQDVLADVGVDLDEIDQLIDDILTTARLDTEHAGLQRRPAHLTELAERAAQRFASRHPTRKLETEVAGDREIECDPLLLRRAIDNLLDNAAKYSDPGSAVRLVAGETSGPGGPCIAFEIVDRGIGMSEDELERAFTPFWRADGSRTRRTGGVGLGLALARRIARAHGGDVTLASAPGQGTTARIDVPLAA